eukprot:365537-Chlamydomonas_euryale.AAC.2
MRRQTAGACGANPHAGAGGHARLHSYGGVRCGERPKAFRRVHAQRACMHQTRAVLIRFVAFSCVDGEAGSGRDMRLQALRKLRRGSYEHRLLQ